MIEITIAFHPVAKADRFCVPGCIMGACHRQKIETSIPVGEYGEKRCMWLRMSIQNAYKGKEIPHQRSNDSKGQGGSARPGA
jgi:hypothetical protein